MLVQHPNVATVWNTIEGDADGIRQVVVVETTLPLDPEAPNFDPMKVEDLRQAVQTHMAERPYLDRFLITRAVS